MVELETATMSQKRPIIDHVPSEKKQRPSLQAVVHEVMFRESWKKFAEPLLEPLIRRVVKEELNKSLKTHFACNEWNGNKEKDSSPSRNLNLKFSTNILLPVFTGAKIKGHDTLRIILVDNVTGEVVDSGPESFSKVEIVVLEGDFDGSESGNWDVEGFEKNIVKSRDAKPLLMGECLIELRAGNGLVGEIVFTDNSSWTRSRKFRLGARVLDQFNCTRIREAKTESFVVRDHRGELYKKHYPPALVDEVWRLEKIGKGGAFHKRLVRENIQTVKDFLTLLTVNTQKLRNILGSGMSKRMWEMTTEHAKTCVLNKEIFLYYPSAFQKRRGVVFNVVGKVLGILLESQYVPLEELPEAEKDDARTSVCSAFEQWKDVIAFKDEASLFSQISSEGIRGFEFGSGGLHELGEFDRMIDNYRPSTTIAPEFSGCEQMYFLNSDGSEDFEDSCSSLFAADPCPEAGGATVAKRRWKTVSCVFKWFQLWRLVTLKRATKPSA